jgi:hypothetical protein
MRVDRDAADRAGRPFVRQRLRPQWVRLEERNLPGAILGAKAHLKMGPYENKREHGRATDYEPPTTNSHLHTHP